MNADDLLMFETVARMGGITRAANELHTVQSNVTYRIRQLERELGVPLFHRHSRGVTLTSSGTQLLPYATQVGQLLSDAHRAVVGDGQPSGPLVLGSLETTAALRLPEALANFTARYSAVDVTLRTGTTQSLIEDVLERRLEGALVAGPVSHPLLTEECIGQEELVLVTAASWGPLETWLSGSSDLKMLVLRTGCSYRQRLETILAQRGIVNVRCLEFGMLDAIMGCVCAGIGITLLPRSVVSMHRLGGSVALHELLPAESYVETVFIRRAGAFASVALNGFLDCLREHAARTDWRPTDILTS